MPTPVILEPRERIKRSPAESNPQGERMAHSIRTHCKRGHPLSGDNLYVVPKTGVRNCRRCNREAHRRYQKTEKGVLNSRKHVSLSKKRDIAKNRARSLIASRIARGKLVKPDVCVVNDYRCGGRIEGHHDDYGKPLNVRWLCVNHHREVHNGFLPA